MKPKTKLQIQVTGLKKKLRGLTKTQCRLAYKNTLYCIGKKTKKGIVCCECAHVFKADEMVKKLVCPACREKLIVDTSGKRVFEQESYFSQITVVDCFQVLRFFHIRSKHKVGERREVKISEVAQRWIRNDGSYTQRGLLRNVFGNFRQDAWVYHSNLEIRNDHPVYNIYTDYVLPKQKLLPELIRNGYDADNFGLTHFDVFYALLSAGKGETLLKAGQPMLFKYYAEGDKWSRETIEKYWPSIKICIRNNYLVMDASSYFDYLGLLEYFGKDLHNAHYVCPDDLVLEHDRLSDKKTVLEKARRLAAKRKEVMEEEELYKKQKGKYFGVSFSDELISVTVLQSVNEFMEEGDALNHCVFSSDYHKKVDSLILSAKIGGNRMETIEVSLKAMKVVQARGINNNDTEHHDQIVRLINSNMSLIQNAKRTRKISA